MRLLVLLILLQPPTLTGEWVGPLEMTVQAPRKARGPVPTVVELTQSGETVTGSWRSLPPNTSTGTFTGRITREGEVTLRVVFYADGLLPNGGEQPERCAAEADLDGRLTGSGVLRLTAKRLLPDKRPRRDCGDWPTDLVWTLQRH